MSKELVADPDSQSLKIVEEAPMPPIHLYDPAVASFTVRMSITDGLPIPEGAEPSED